MLHFLPILSICTGAILLLYGFVANTSNFIAIIFFKVLPIILGLLHLILGILFYIGQA